MNQLPVQILLRSSEITLKGRNQRDFWAQLRTNAHLVLRSQGLNWPVNRESGRLFVDVRDYKKEVLNRAIVSLKNIAGISSIACAQYLPRSEEDLAVKIDRLQFEKILLDLAQEHYESGRSFAVRVHRVDKQFPMQSSEIETWLGEVIRKNTAWDRVRLASPDCIFHVDIYSDKIFFYADKTKGVGGLPVGSSGSVMALLSGGIDSPVASYLMARRGCSVDWFHMSAVNVTKDSLGGSLPDRLASQLSLYTLRSRLFVVPYTYFDLALRGNKQGHGPVLFRRFLFRTAQTLARKLGAVSLVTGDSLSQVASQTIENLIATDKAVEMPVLRPLIGLDKHEIVSIARSIDTYEISIEPYKDCCALHTGRVRTKTRDVVLSSIEEEHLGSYDNLVADSLNDMVWANYSVGKRLEQHIGLSRLSEKIDIV